MLQCIKGWLIPACLLLFFLCGSIGWIFGKPPEKVVPPILVPPAQEQMTFVFNRYYDLNGKAIMATTFIGSNKTGDSVPVEKQTYDINTKKYITVKPEDAKRYQPRTFEVTWLNRTQFLTWLKNDFSKELSAKGANMQTWQPILKKIEFEAAPTSCNYPVVLDGK